jgi:L-threonylcarbamoyladenylate synthase
MTTDIKNCLEVLKAGGLILYPTDTVWGIGCDATNPTAVQKVYQLKKRDDSKSLIILLADEKDLLYYTAELPPEIFAYLKNTDKPTTVIYNHALGLPDNLVQQDGSIAIRIVNEPFCKALIERFHKPIISTSANISGEPAAQNFSAISKEIKNGVDYVVQYRRDDKHAAVPSRIIRFDKEGRLQIIRP